TPGRASERHPAEVELAVLEADPSLRPEPQADELQGSAHAHGPDAADPAEAERLVALDRVRVVARHLEADRLDPALQQQARQPAEDHGPRSLGPVSVRVPVPAPAPVVEPAPAVRDAEGHAQLLAVPFVLGGTEAGPLHGLDLAVRHREQADVFPG